MRFRHLQGYRPKVSDNLGFDIGPKPKYTSVFGRRLERLNIGIGKDQLISEHNILRCLFSRKLPIQRQGPTPLNNLYELYLGPELQQILDLEFETTIS